MLNARIFFLHPNITEPLQTLTKGQMHTHYGCEFTAQRDGTAGGYQFSDQYRQDEEEPYHHNPALPFLPL